MPSLLRVVNGFAELTRMKACTGMTFFSNRYLSRVQLYSTNTASEVEVKSIEFDRSGFIEHDVDIIGWVTAIRRHKTRVFLTLCDGTSPHTLQVVSPVCPTSQKLVIGSAVEIHGTLRPSPQAKDCQSESPNQTELHANRLELLDQSHAQDTTSSANLLPQPKMATGIQAPRPNLGLLRSAQGLAWRHRLPEFAAVLRLRACVKQILRSVMSDMEYLEVDTPILTTTECEEGGQSFTVHSPSRAPKSPPVYLTGSAQLHLEALALGMSKVFTLGPTFRAETSHTRHHLAEFHMLELESVHLTTVDRLCNEIEAAVKMLLTKFRRSLFSADREQERSIDSWTDIMYDLSTVHFNLSSEENWSGNRFSKELNPAIGDKLLSNLDNTLAQPFPRIPFTEAVSYLRPSTLVDQLQTDFSKEEEIRLVEYFGGSGCLPVFITHFPVHLKPFYCKSHDGRWTESVDLVFPGVGEMVGGSVREDSPHVLRHRLTSAVSTGQALTSSSLNSWYVEQLRENPGSAPHGGFGLGFERLLQWLSGVYSLRDLIPFPRLVDKISL